VRTDELDYALPEDLIAQRPAERRDASRLLVHRRDGRIEHRRFDELPELLDPGDLVVVNSSRVLRARIAVRRPTGGTGEVLLLEERADGLWEALVRPSRRTHPGARLRARDGELTIKPVEELGDGRWVVRPSLRGSALEQALEQAGRLPLPPYIRDPAVPDDRYQTVYARLT
jgi:S-adenosylmethionine:tRNA ribosyltransferase-isomerase